MVEQNILGSLYDKFSEGLKFVTGSSYKNTSGISPPNEMEDLADENGFVFRVPDGKLEPKEYFIPEEILGFILSWVDFRDLVFSCRLVCRSWRVVIENLVLRQKSDRDHLKKLHIAFILPLDKKKLLFPWYIYYLACYKELFNKNLLKNNCGQDNLKYWSILSNGGDRWKIEDVPVGSDPLPKDCDDFGGNLSCFATSYHSNSKIQIINLYKEGFNKKVMDDLMPVIKISEWFAGRFDCGCVYELKVALLNKNQKPIADFEQRLTINQREGRKWQKIEYDFKDYGPGVQYVSFYHGGMDSQFWAGHYGTKMAGGAVRLFIDSREII